MMTRTHLRVLFLGPVILAAIGAAGMFGDHSSWPEPAQAYLRWYLAQPLSDIAIVQNRTALLGLLGLLLSTVGLLLFWSPARYLYLISLLLTFVGEVPDVPVIAGGWVNLLDAVGQTLVGINIALIFTAPGRTYFARAPVAA